MFTCFKLVAFLKNSSCFIRAASVDYFNISQAGLFKNKSLKSLARTLSTKGGSRHRNISSPRTTSLLQLTKNFESNPDNKVLKLDHFIFF